MKAVQINQILDLNRCTFLPGSFDKRFVRSLFDRAENDDKKPLTEKQARYLEQLHHKYRKQIGSLNHNLHCTLCQKVENRRRV